MLGATPNLVCVCVCVCVCGHSSASLPEPWAAGPDTAGRKDLQTMFMTVGLLLGLAKKDRLYTGTHTHTHTRTNTHILTYTHPEKTHRLAWSLDCRDYGLT